MVMIARINRSKTITFVEYHTSYIYEVGSRACVVVNSTIRQSF